VATNLALLGAPPTDTGVDIGVPLDREIGAHGAGVSAGQGQRLALSRTLARGDGGPRLLLLDEPTAHLDTGLVEDIGAVLRARAAAGDAVVVATHDPRLLALADEVVSL